MNYTQMTEQYKLIIHPSLLEYDYRIAWTWDEMKNRNKKNILVDELRISCGMNARPYGRPLYSIWKTHWGKDRGIKVFGDVGDFGNGKTLNRMVTKGVL